MEFTQKAIILKVGNFGENHCWVRFVTPKQGIVMAYAFGGRKSRRRFCGCLDGLSLVLLKVGSDKFNRYLCLQEGSLLNSFSNLKKKSSHLGMAVNCTLFFSVLLQEGVACESAYKLLLNCLEALDSSESIPEFFPLLFRARMLFEQGYFPCIEHCFGCDQALEELDTIDFHLSEGNFYCPDCRPPAGDTVKIQSFSLAFLYRLLNTDPLYWSKLQLDAGLKKDCFQLVDSFLEKNLGIVWEAGRFRQK